MRVLLLSSFFYPHYGGSERYMEELYVNLIKVNSSVEVDVICYNTNYVAGQEKYRGLNIYRLSCWQILPGQFVIPNYFSLIKLINQLVRKHSYDLVHSNTRFFEHSWWAPFLARIIGARSILTDHCATYPIHRYKLVSACACLIDKVSTRLFARFYDLTTVSTKATLKFSKSIGLKQPHFIRQGVDTDFFKPSDKHIKKVIPNLNQKIADKEIVISFVGRMIQTKGPQILLKVAKELVQKYPKVRFVFAGSGNYYEQLRVQGGSKIHFVGALSQVQVAQLLKNTDIFVLPSFHHEGLPTVILEAGASGCAVVATDNGGIKEAVINNQTGLLIKPTAESLQNALEKLIMDRPLRTKFSRAIRNKIEKNFDWKIIVKQFQALIKKNMIIDKRSRIWFTI